MTSLYSRNNYERDGKARDVLRGDSVAAGGEV
jgi:hypothetical protein